MKKFKKARNADYRSNKGAQTVFIVQCTELRSRIARSDDKISYLEPPCGFLVILFSLTDLGFWYSCDTSGREVA